MKIINIDISDKIEIKNIEDTKTGKINILKSTLMLPTGNYNNIILNFNFIGFTPDENINLLTNFSLSHNKKVIEVALSTIKINNKEYKYACYVPAEVFEKQCTVTLGLYGFLLKENGELEKRISLVPTLGVVVKGSYDPKATGTIVPSPTVFEVYFDNVAKANAQMANNLEYYNKKLTDSYNDYNDAINKQFTEASKNLDEYNENIETLYNNANQALKKIKHFNSVEEMKADNTLVAGYVVDTLGYFFKNDSGGARYTIREKTGEDIEDGESIIFLVNGLVAEKIKGSILKFHSVAESSATYIVELPNGKNMIVDTGTSTQWDSIKRAIDSLGITKFDYIVITHFHSDHCGNIQNIIDTYDVSSANWYIGMKPDFINYGDKIDETEASYDEQVNILTSNGIKPIVPENNSYLKIDTDVKLRFLNTDENIASSYYGTITEYRDKTSVNFNHFSLITEIIHGDIVILTTGDIEKPVEKAYAPYMNKCAVMTAPHHGINRDADRAFYYATQPKFSILSYITDSDTWITLFHKSFRLLRELNSVIITSRWSAPINGLFSFISDGKNVNTTVLGNGLLSNTVLEPKLYANIQELVNYTEKPLADITLEDVFNNMNIGSTLLTTWWSTYATTFSTLYNELLELFPNMSSGMRVELKKDGSSYKRIKVFSDTVEYIAESLYDDINWLKSGRGKISNISGIDNLINIIDTLDIGNYTVSSYTDDKGTVLSTSGGYMLNINIVDKYKNNEGVIITNAIIYAVLRHTGTASNATTRVAMGYINTSSDPKYVWLRVDN